MLTPLQNHCAFVFCPVYSDLWKTESVRSYLATHLWTILFLLENNCFTLLCWFLQFINMNQPQVYMSAPSWTSLPLPTPSHLSRLSPSTVLSSLHHTANSHWLPILHTVMYVSTTLPICPFLPFPHWVHKSVLYVCISIVALQIGSSVPFF